MRRLLAGFLLGSLCMLMGCGMMGGGSTGSTGGSGGATSAERPSDSQIVSNIQSAFKADDALDAANIDVSASDGVVTLSGNVPNAFASLRAQSLARRVNGVKELNVSNLRYPQ